MIDTYWNCIQKKIINNRRLLICVLLTTVLCFGFTISNYSIGVDDPARKHYFYSTLGGSMIQQGRLLHLLVNELTGVIDFIPFFSDFVGASLFATSALLFYGLFQYVTRNKLSDISGIAFCCLYISYSIINEKFIYQLDVVVTMLSYCLTAIALMYSYRFVQEKRFSDLAKAVVVLILAIGSYETFVFLYFCGVFAIFLLEILFNKKQLTIKEIFFAGIKYALILVVSVILYYGIVFAVQLLTGQFGVFFRKNAWTGKKENLLSFFILLTKSLGKAFLYSDYFPVQEFVWFAILGFVLFLILSIKHKNLGVFLCWIGFFAGNMLIHYIKGSIMYRGAQTFCLLIGFVAVVLIEQIRPIAVLKKLAIVCVLLLTLVQSADMNKWFWNDYLRYKKESFAAHTIATELVANYDISKPVVFTNGWKSFANGGFLHTHYIKGGQANGNSVLYWGAGVFSGDIEVLHTFFQMEGYDFLIVPEQEQVDLAEEESKGMPRYPEPGYIRETEEYIIVNLGVVE